MFSKPRKVLWGFLFLAGLLFPPTTLAVQSGDEIRIDVPADGQIKVRNDFGNVSVELWNNSYVAVSATFETTAKFTRSPIVIDNRGKLLTISVVRRPIDPTVAIHLTLKVPVNANISGTSAEGPIKVDREAAAPKQPELIGVNNAK